jgi:hypothetical protein
MRSTFMTLDLKEDLGGLWDLGKPNRLLLTKNLTFVDRSTWGGWTVVALACIAKMIGFSYGDLFDISKVAVSVEAKARMQLQSEPRDQASIIANGKRLLEALKIRVNRNAGGRAAHEGELNALDNAIRNIAGLIPKREAPVPPTQSAASTAAGVGPYTPPPAPTPTAARPTDRLPAPDTCFPTKTNTRGTAVAAAGMESSAPAPAAAAGVLQSFLSIEPSQGAYKAAEDALKYLGREMLEKHPEGDFATGPLGLMMLVIMWAMSSADIEAREKMVHETFKVSRTIPGDEFFAAVCHLLEEFLKLEGVAAGQCFALGKDAEAPRAEERLKASFAPLQPPKPGEAPHFEVFKSTPSQSDVVETVHKWLSRLTGGNINTILPTSPPLVWALVSALYGKFDWETVFDFNKNGAQPEMHSFALSDGSDIPNVPMMWHKGMPGLYGEVKVMKKMENGRDVMVTKAQVLGLDYKPKGLEGKSRLIQWFVVPGDNFTLRDIEPEMDALISEARPRDKIKVAMPRIKTKIRNKGLLGDLTKMGIHFEPEGLPLAEAGVEEVLLKMDENGATVVTVAALVATRGVGGPPPPPEVTLNRSFALSLRGHLAGKDVEVLRMRIDSGASLDMKT